ncbi:PAS domain-containing protein [Salinadaptatus halalkaliphilus]|uniref:PAS domain-containing protein n=1 Tax=Salinadaptatus halalkaliphilus TaxID=2419781 RepID=A0A4S3TGC9_9EURY|nr:methyl-accepting chemotaxis protein [Salinadaptatus halalkaliphilus]THE62892.1 PAS domain-containing protein [Salinadaptatus halalkaliphilus]
MNYLDRITGGRRQHEDDESDRPSHESTDKRQETAADGSGGTVTLDDTETVGEIPDADTRLERARATVGYTDATDRKLEQVGDGDELDIAVPDIEAVYPTSVPVDAAARQARILATALERDRDADRASRVASSATQQAEAGIPPSAYVATYQRSLHQLVERTFETLEDGGDLEDAREELKAGIDATLVDCQLGVDEFVEQDGTPPITEDGGEDEYVDAVGIDDVLDAMPRPAFLIDDEHTVLHYNVALNRLLNLEDDHREYLGKDSRETVAAATYQDGRRHNTLADKILKNPHDAHEAWDVERVDDDIEYADHIVYEDTSIATDHTGAETHIEFYGMPFFDDDGELLGVLEFTEDRSEAVRRQRSVEELITEVTDTLYQIGDGNLAARAEFEDEHDVVESELLELTDDVNEMATNFEQIVTQVDQRTTDLADSIEHSIDYADRIDEQAMHQNESLETVADEMEDFSATMEEVAASSQEVADAAESALEEVDTGVEASQDASDVTDEVLAISEELVDTVEQLDSYMDEISEVADVIADVADQTNLLALNANIEAAKADDAGAGFAVVANEVKNLAAETQNHTDEIAAHIDQVQSQTVETVDEVERSHDHIQDVETEIDSVLESLETISERVESAADGIQEVADANDKQAATVEEVMATVEDVRESSQRVTETTDEIVDETERQEQTVFELSDRVEQLSSSDS